MLCLAPMASMTTNPTTENERKTASKVFHRPPSGKQLADTQAVHPATRDLGTAQFLFEPTPPVSRKLSRSPSPHARKIQSAKPHIATSSCLKDDTLLPQGGVRGRQRPKSATQDLLRVSRHQPGSAEGGRSIPKQFLVLDTSTDAASATSTYSTLSHPTGQRLVCKQCPSLDTNLTNSEDDKMLTIDDPLYKMSSNAEIKLWKERGKVDTMVARERTIPRGIAKFRPWLMEDVPTKCCGVDPSACLVFLPSILYEVTDLPIVPPVQQPSDVLPHTVIPPAPKPFDPKKLFHYQAKPLPAAAPTSKHHKSLQLAGVHNWRNSVNRTQEIIRQEIEDLENVLQGIGNADSSNLMAQYQADIRRLQWSVKDTLVQCYQIESHFRDKKVQEPSDILGLRRFLRDKERILNRIKARREACLLELKQLKPDV